jgi:peptidoglycan-associated lipoprotein
MNLRISVTSVFVVLFGLFLISGCGAKKTDDEVKPEQTSLQGAGSGQGLEEPLETEVIVEISEGRTSEGLLPVYFDFDKSDIRSDQEGRMRINSDFMKENPAFTVRIEGNTDPRGSNEYNMALGERRALSAKKYMTNLGIDEARLDTISYGEERLLMFGNDELSWAQNRRADFVINR